jgi:phosphotransferase system enzyme I (PtsI)
LVGVGVAAIEALQTGDTVVLDAGAGILYQNPDPATLQAADARRGAWEEEQKRLQALRGKPTQTRSGRAVQLYANAAFPADIESVLESDAEGIGLFRSEFLYMGQDAPPDEQTQYEIYREILTRMRGRRVIIRTLDVGADKQARCLPSLPKEENPALGCRAVRYSLKYPALFLTQARALLRASAHGTLSVMFPLISSEEELRGILSLWERAREEVGTAASVPLGIMIETPAAALISDRLATMVDFFSIGSNDLTQYTLAMDRQNEFLQPFYRPHHPAVLSLIRTTVQNAKAAGIWVGICGELGADTSLTEQFLRMGVDELSVAPAHVLALRAHISQLDL